jgi:hypothetical protein
LFRTALKAAGMFLLVMGTIWTLQGLGLLTWPTDSFMLADRIWARNGAITAGVGAVMLWWAFRRPRG